ncbi:Endopolyphosphatase [Aureobasidium melanogenum CBS 110374]|uniref:Endopolyphosphatase n=1 Tax=Aureobasidium melanogenum (strain CBS 110374) TaxID=1043003 RepID=A0A074VDP6_AURM1|nr:Endopolyphosphatase [Aureobasidium melanogenum CBS 110374]KEQ58493.1 Endopolyphosphatase [Aureobasidium melanogenum CBS 110374]
MAKRRQLHGRFLQVTDFHPDPFYKVHSSIDSDGACHRGHGPAGYYGAETSDCDSPISLINATFDWIRDELKDSIDFVIWTGDSARHDNDEKIPRNVQQVTHLNQLLVEKFYEVFAKNEDEPDDDPTNDLVVPVIPTFGNNDILPHNIFDKGPNLWTRRYLDIWRPFIPEVQKHSFDQGGWFYVEAIPNHLAVVSLNSLYFFNSNSAVDGCAAKSEPGYRQLDWLRIQLQYLRDRNMKAIITGHVPPARTDNKNNWDETCWQKYTLWMHQYRDVIVATLYGHMNTDHFIVQDFDQVDDSVVDGYETIKSSNKRGMVAAAEQQFGIQSATSYLKDLRKSWTKLPKPQADEDADALKNGKKHKGKKPHNPDDYDAEIGGRYAERFSISHVSPSVVPNYFPTIRVYEYNITGLDRKLPRTYEDMFELHATEIPEDEQSLEEDLIAEDEDLEAERKKKKKKPKKHRFTVPKPPSKSAPPGPAYSPQSLTLLGFVQYYANLTRINNNLVEDDAEQQRRKDGKPHGNKPFDHNRSSHPKNFTYEVLYDTRSDKVYDLEDLTTRSYLRLAQRIAGVKPRKSDVQVSGEDLEEVEEVEVDEALDADAHQGDMDITKKKHKKKKGDKKKKSSKDNKPWYTFVRRAFVDTLEPDDIEEEF